MPKQSTIDFRLLRVFLVVSDSGSMTSAAQKLGLTQSAVSQAIRQLENDLEVSLIDRDHRPMQLTAAGNALRGRAARLVDEVNQLPHFLQELGRTKLPEMRIGMIDSCSATIGPQLVKELMQAAVRLTMWSGNAAIHTEALLQREVDLIVTSDALDDVDGLDRFLLMREPYLLVVPTPQAKMAEGLPLSQLAAKFPLIRYSGRSSVGRQIEQYLRRLGVNAPRTVEVDDSAAVLSMVSSGLGWALTTPLCILHARGHMTDVTPLRVPTPGMNRFLMLLARSGEYETLPRRVAASAQRLLMAVKNEQIKQIIPWLGDELVIGSVKQREEARSE